MATSGPLSASVAANNNSVGAVAWANPNNAKACDASFSIAAPLLANDTNALVLTGFGFSIPRSAVVRGITVTIKRKSVSGTVSDLTISLTTGGVTGTVNHADTLTPWPNTNTVATYGSSSDSWGGFNDPPMVNATTFGVVIQAQSADALAADAEIDCVTVTVEYNSTGWQPK